MPDFKARSQLRYFQSNGSWAWIQFIFTWLKFSPPHRVLFFVFACVQRLALSHSLTPWSSPVRGFTGLPPSNKKLGSFTKLILKYGWTKWLSFLVSGVVGWQANQSFGKAYENTLKWIMAMRFVVKKCLCKLCYRCVRPIQILNCCNQFVNI